MDDWELIEEYVGKQSAGAFEALVGRYLQMVYGVAMREVGEHHLAEDVTQAVFALLAKKAPEMVERRVVAGWLFQTARYAARNAKKMERRRRFHEGQAGRMKLDEMAGGEAEREERMRLLDCAMERLGERDRGAVLLRYYRRLEMAEVGKALGVSEVAARKRVERAVGRLRVGMGATDALGMVGAMGVVAVKTPAGVAEGALACANGTGGHETVTVIMKGALKMMYWAKMKVAAMVVTGLVVVGGAGTWTVTRLQAEGADEKPAVVVAPASLEKQVAALDAAIKADRAAFDEFCRTYSVPEAHQEIDIQQQYDMLARMDTMMLDASLRVTDLKYALDAAKQKATAGTDSKSVDDAQEAYTAALSKLVVLTQMRDQARTQLRDLNHWYSRAESMAAELKALEAARNELYVKMVMQKATEQ